MGIAASASEPRGKSRPVPAIDRPAIAARAGHCLASATPKAAAEAQPRSEQSLAASDRRHRKRIAKAREEASRKKTKSSIRSSLERITEHRPLSSGMFDPIHIFPSGRSGVETFAYGKMGDYPFSVPSSVGAQFTRERARDAFTREPMQCKSEVSADDFMKLITILNDNLCD